MPEPFERRLLSGWGRMAPAECAVYRPERLAALARTVAEAGDASLIARGLGRSYGDTAVNGGAGVVDMTRLDRMLDFDESTGTLSCEGGVSLSDILASLLPRGYFPPVTPGTKHVTVGGMIANDVHGKNHHRDGSISRYVERLELLTASGETLVCSPEQNAEVFWATTGGIGLTGIILSARLRLQRVPSAYMVVDYERAHNLEHALALIAASEKGHQYSVAWVDCLARGKRLGRAVIMGGRHAEADELPISRRGAPYAVAAKRVFSVPFNAPGFALNPVSISAFNMLYYARHPNRAGVVTDYETYFYPLDTVEHWNRMYGRAGFTQYQATLPFESGAGLVKLLERLSVSRRASFLAVLKCFAEAGPGMLSHPMPGYTLTLDIANRRGLIPFLHELDRILLDHGGRLYLAKDIATTASAFRQMYPRVDEFLAVKGRVDPGNRFSSNQARRLGLEAA